MVGIYKITSPSGKIYIGQSIDIERRLRYYKKLRCKKQPKLLHSFLKYGYDQHIVEIILECETHQLNENERLYQELFDCINNGLNCTLTRANDKSGKLSQQTKLKISNAIKNPSAETRKKMSKGQMGKVVPLEMRKKISESHKGKKHSIETRLKIAENSRNISDETRRKYVESHLGNRHTEETKRKISEAGIGRKFSVESKNKISEKNGFKVINIITGEVFPSVSKVALHENCSASWLNTKLKGKATNNTNYKYL